MRPLFYFVLGAATTILLRLVKTSQPAHRITDWSYMTALGNWVYSRISRKKETPTDWATEDVSTLKLTYADGTVEWMHMDAQGNWTVIGSNGKKVKR